MAKQTNAYIQRRAQDNLSEDDRAAYAAQQDPSAVSNDILRAMLASKAEEGMEGEYPSELPPEVFDTVYAHSMLTDAYVDQVRERVNKKGPAVRSSMLALAALEADRNTIMISTTFAAAEELIDETPAGWSAAQHYASPEQKKEIGDLPAKTASLRQMTLAAGGFIRDAVRVPEGPELILPGEVTSTGVEDARPVLGKHIELAKTYGPESTVDQLQAALGNPNVKGTEAFHVERMIDADVGHEALVEVMGRVGLSFADFPNAAIAHFMGQESVRDESILELLMRMQVAEHGVGYDEKIVDLHPVADPDLFMAQLHLVRSFNALVEFQAARRVVDPPDGETPERLSTEDDIAALTGKPLEAAQHLAAARSLGLTALVEGADAARAQLDIHAMNVTDAAIQGEMTHEFVFGAKPGSESEAVLMAQAEEAAKQALEAAEAVRSKAEAIGMNLPGVPATDRLKAWYGFAKSVKSSKEKAEAVASEGLGGAGRYDAFQAAISVAKAAAGVIKGTAEAAATAYGDQAARLESHLPRPHLHDIVNPTFGFGDLGMDKKSTPEIDGLLGQEKAFKALAKGADGVALVGDVIGLADGVKAIAEGDVASGSLDLIGGAVGIAGTVAARRVAAQGLAAGASFNIAQAAGPAGYLVAYFQLIQSAFASVKAAEEATLARLGMGVFSGVQHQIRRGGQAAQKAGLIQRRLKADEEATEKDPAKEDPARRAALVRELERETKVAAEVVEAAHTGLLGILNPDLQGSAINIYPDWLDWPKTKAALRTAYVSASTQGIGLVKEAGDLGSFDTFQEGSAKVFLAMDILAKTVAAHVKDQAE